MYYYFSANTPTAIKLDGAYLGILSDHKKQINILSKDTLVELCPLSQNCSPTCFILNDEFLSSPVENVKIVDLKGGYYIYFENYKKGEKYGVITQKKSNSSIATVFYDGGLKLSIETKNDFFNALLPSCCEFKSFFELANGNFLVLLTKCGDQDRAFVFSIKNKIEQKLDVTADVIEIDEIIIATENKCDILKHQVVYKWQIEGDSVTLINKYIRQSESVQKEKLTKEIIPYAFLEEFLVDGDFTYYMCDDMKANAQKLSGYLGEFIGVMPPPHFIPFDQIGLIRKISERLYRVDYLTVTVENNKITNIKLN